MAVSGLIRLTWYLNGGYVATDGCSIWTVLVENGVTEVQSRRMLDTKAEHLSPKDHDAVAHDDTCSTCGTSSPCTLDLGFGGIDDFCKNHAGELGKLLISGQYRPSLLFTVGDCSFYTSRKAQPITLDEQTCTDAFAALTERCLVPGNDQSNEELKMCDEKYDAYDVEPSIGCVRFVLHFEGFAKREDDQRPRPANLALRETDSVHCSVGALPDASELNNMAQQFCQDFQGSTQLPGQDQEIIYFFPDGGLATFTQSNACSAGSNGGEHEQTSFADCLTAFEDIIITCQGGSSARSNSAAWVTDWHCLNYSIAVEEASTTAHLASRQYGPAPSSEQVQCAAGSPIDSIGLQDIVNNFCTVVNNDTVLANDTAHRLTPLPHLPGVMVNVSVTANCGTDIQVNESLCKANFGDIPDDCDNGNTESAGGLNTFTGSDCGMYVIEVLV
jgi:hypothetical protein